MAYNSPDSSLLIAHCLYEESLFLLISTLFSEVLHFGKMLDARCRSLSDISGNGIFFTAAAFFVFPHSVPAVIPNNARNPKQC